MCKTEKIVAFINTNVFFKEFSFSRNEFTTPDGKSQLQLADNVIWLENILFIYQIKDRDIEEGGDEVKWFVNKVQKKAVKQIKGTLEYFSKYKNITVTNERGHSINISEANPENAKKIIVYTSAETLPEEKRFLKFHRSKTVGLIHLFHSEDYGGVCRFLFTPSEIAEYLSFRETLYEKHEQVLNSLPEQYVLGHFLESTDTDNIDLTYLENLKKMIKNESEFDVSVIINLFQERIVKIGSDNDYYFIIKEIAKLDRAELKEFKLRFKLSLEKAKSQTFTLPYRISSLRTNCGFVFIPLEYKHSAVWQNALFNFTYAHKYEQKNSRCIGMAVCYDLKQKFYDINWSYVESEWCYNQEMEKLLKENNPFRDVSLRKTNKYYFKE
ncbi:MAG TPA: hypothetical protein PLT92_13955 [Ignavibacteriaceae bacterium]|nr:hypothetical protein [Ignavibacteriaceae bacterium]